MPDIQSAHLTLLGDSTATDVLTDIRSRNSERLQNEVTQFKLHNANLRADNQELRQRLNAINENLDTLHEIVNRALVEDGLSEAVLSTRLFQIGEFLIHMRDKCSY